MGRTIRKVGLACVRDGRLLVVRKRGLDLWVLPGGKPESDDAGFDSRTLAREVREELRCGLRGPLEFLQRIVSPAAGRPGDFLHLSVYAGELDRTAREGAEVVALDWVRLEDLTEAAAALSIARDLVPLLAARESAPTGRPAGPSAPTPRDVPAFARQIFEGRGDRAWSRLDLAGGSEPRVVPDPLASATESEVARLAASIDAYLRYVRERDAGEARALDVRIEGVVRDELRRQLGPGGLLGTTRRLEVRP